MKVPTVVLYSTHGTSFTCTLVTIIEYADYLSKSDIAWQIFDGRWSAVRTLQPFCTVWRYHPVEGVACRLTTSIFSTTWLPSIMVLKLHVFRGIIFTCTWESSLHFNTMSLQFVLVFQRSQVKLKKSSCTYGSPRTAIMFEFAKAFSLHRSSN